MPQDYILRLLQQLGAVVATIAGRRGAGDLEGAEAEIADQCQRHTGLPWAVVRQADPDTLIGLLGMGGALQVPRTLTLAELLREDGLLSEQRGNPLSAVASYRQASALIAHVAPALPPDEQAHFRERQLELAAKLRDLAGE